MIQALLTIVLAGVCVAAVMSATKTQQTKTLAGIDIFINNSRYGFITENDVKGILQHDGGIRVNMTRLSQLNVKKMERIISNNPWVEAAQVYVDNQQVLHAVVTQRIPVARIFEKNGDTYYIDRKMEQMPRCDKYNYYTTVVTNVPELKSDSAGKALKGKIIAMVNYIKRDTFWNEQVSQLVVTDNLGFEIVPVLGNHRIVFGDTVDMPQKFNNLFAFYTKVLNQVGWDKYEVLDLSYKGQLVASPSLSWKLPVDKVINNINWVNSILTGDTTVTSAITAKTVKLAAMNAPEHTAPLVTAAAQQQKKVVQPGMKPAPIVVKKAVAAKPVVKQAEVKKPVHVTVAKPLPAEKKTVNNPAPKPKIVPAKSTPEKLKATPKAVPEKKKQDKQTKKPAKESKAKQEDKKIEQEDKKPKYIYNG